MVGIYQIKNKITNEIYIGSSRDIEHRWSCHKGKPSWLRHPNMRLYQDFQKYGLENFDFSMVEECEESELRQREDFYIQTLNPSYNQRRAYNPDCNKNYHKTDKGRSHKKSYNKNYYSHYCCYNGEILSLNALSIRFYKSGIQNPVSEAKKYLVS